MGVRTTNIVLMENTLEKETVKIADKQAPVCRHLKQKTTDHIDEELRSWKFLRLKFSQLFFFLVMLEF